MQLPGNVPQNHKIIDRNYMQNFLNRMKTGLKFDFDELI